MSFVCEGSEALHVDDLIDVLGSDKQTQAEECMVFLDKDANGDVSLEEMV
jgi:Ca2+-binding EF-hand superfamily protein